MENAGKSGRTKVESSFYTSLKWSHGFLSTIFGFLIKFWVGIYIIIFFKRFFQWKNLKFWKFSIFEKNKKLDFLKKITPLKKIFKIWIFKFWKSSLMVWIFSKNIIFKKILNKKSIKRLVYLNKGLPSSKIENFI